MSFRRGTRNVDSKRQRVYWKRMGKDRNILFTVVAKLSVRVK